MFIQVSRVVPRFYLVQTLYHNVISVRLVPQIYLTQGLNRTTTRLDSFSASEVIVSGFPFPWSRRIGKISLVEWSMLGSPSRWSPSKPEARTGLHGTVEEKSREESVGGKVSGVRNYVIIPDRSGWQIGRLQRYTHSGLRAKKLKFKREIEPHPVLSTNKTFLSHHRLFTTRSPR